MQFSTGDSLLLPPDYFIKSALFQYYFLPSSEYFCKIIIIFFLVLYNALYIYRAFTCSFFFFSIKVHFLHASAVQLQNFGLYYEYGTCFLSCGVDVRGNRLRIHSIDRNFATTLWMCVRKCILIVFLF